MYYNFIQAGGFEYYGNYIQERTQQNNAQYTYQQFVEDEKQKGNDHYDTYSKGKN